MNIIYFKIDNIDLMSIIKNLQALLVISSQVVDLSMDN